MPGVSDQEAFHSLRLSCPDSRTARSTAPMTIMGSEEVLMQSPTGRRPVGVCMRTSWETMIVIGAVLPAFLLSGQAGRTEWKASWSDTPGMVYFEVERHQPGSHSSQSSDVPLSAFRRLNPGQSGPAKFEYAADAGTFACQGRFSRSEAHTSE